MVILHSNLPRAQGYTAQECVDRSMDLLLSDRAKPKQTTTIYDHLLRLGLERYASLLEFHGIATWADMQSRMYSNEGFSVQTELVPLSMALKYDEWAVGRFSSMVSNSGQIYFDSAMAEISDIRDAFLDAYPTDHELVHEERAPLLRLQQTKSVGATPIEVVGIARSLMRSESESNPWAAVAGAGAGDAAAHGGAGLLSFSSAVSAASASASASASAAHAAAVLPPSLTLLKRASESFYSGSVGDGGAGGGGSVRTGRALDDAELDRLSLAFVDALTRNGRGALSHFNLRQILAAHPNRPVECVRAARAFVRERPIESHLLPQVFQQFAPFFLPISY
jgi:hypothetical protein